MKFNEQFRYLVHIIFSNQSKYEYKHIMLCQGRRTKHFSEYDNELRENVFAEFQFNILLIDLFWRLITYLMILYGVLLNGE